MIREELAAVEALVNRLRPVLAGQPPARQGAALADCLAFWLAGHQIEGDPAKTRELRAQLLAHHLLGVEALVPVNARAIGTVP